MSAPCFIPAGQSDQPIPFHSIDALAVHLLRQRPGRKLELLPQVCTRNGGPDFPVVAVFAVAGPRTLRSPEPAFEGDRTEHWLGFTAGERACEPDELAAALHRMRTAGGLAA